MQDKLQVNSLHALSQKKKDSEEPKEPKEPKQPRTPLAPKPQNISLDNVTLPEKKKGGRPKGSKNKPKVKRTFRTMVLKTDASSNDERVYYCSCCGKGYKAQKTNYYMSSSVIYKENNGYIQMCKVCANKYFSQLKEFFLGNIPKAIERCCQLFDWYYSPKCIEAMLKSNIPINSELSSYLAKVNMYQIKEQGTDYLQTLIDNDEKECRINSYEDLENHTQQYAPDEESKNQETIERYVVTRDDVRKWGEGYTPEEYEYLGIQYDEWSKTLEEQSNRIVYDKKVMEELVKNICVSLLTIRRYQRVNSDKLGGAMKTFQDLLSTCNLQPELVTDSNSSSIVPYGVLTKMIEDDEPIGEPNPEWKDVDGIRKYINTWYLGGLSKAVHLNNPNATMYEEALKEYEKYTIDNQSKEFVGDISIFDSPQQQNDSYDDPTQPKDVAETIERDQARGS